MGRGVDACDEEGRLGNMAYLGVHMAYLGVQDRRGSTPTRRSPPAPEIYLARACEPPDEGIETPVTGGWEHRW